MKKIILLTIFVILIVFAALYFSDYSVCNNSFPDSGERCKCLGYLKGGKKPTSALDAYKSDKFDRCFGIVLKRVAVPDTRID